MSRRLAWLVSHLMPEWPVLEPRDREVVRVDVHRFVQEQLAGASLALRIPARLLGAGFATFACVARLGWEVHERAGQERKIELWQSLGFPFRGYVRLVRSLTMLAFLEHPLVRDALNLQDLERLQRDARQRRHLMILASA